MIIASGLTSSGTAYNSGKKIARATDGTLYACFYSTVSSYTQISVYKSIDDGLTWTNTNFPQISGYNQYYPSITIDSNNKVHVIWKGTDSSNTVSAQIKYSNNVSGSWSSWINIQTISGYQHQVPTIAIDSNNKIHVVWYGTDSSNATNTQIKYSNNVSGTWSSWVNIQTISGYNQLMPSIAVDSNNKVHVAWYGTDSSNATNTQIKYSNNVSGTWSSWINIQTISGYSQNNPSITIDSNNKIHMVWHGTDSSSSGYQIKYSNNVSGTWSSWINIQTISGYSQNNPSITIDSNDKVHVTWHGTDSSNTTYAQIKYSNNVSGTWSPWANKTNSSVTSYSYSSLVQFNEILYFIYNDDAASAEVHLQKWRVPRTNINQISTIGDNIICSYNAINNGFGVFYGLGTSNDTYIPTSSSTTPNGSFNWIYVGDDFKGRKILIADRNIQKGISWDTLNTAGVASGSGLPINIKCIPNMTSNTTPSPYVVSSRSIFNSSYDCWKSFDDSNTSHYIGGNPATADEWIQIDLGSSKNIVSYDLANSGAADGSYVSSWDLLGSNTGAFAGEETTLDSRNGIASSKDIINYKVSTPGSYRYYRWKLKAGYTYYGLGKIRLYENTNYEFTTRLLTGGVSSADEDNEWIKYIFGSTLGGLTTAGDTTFWGQTNVWSLTSTTYSNGNRTVYGHNAVGTLNGRSSVTTSDTNPADTGFRPVLIVEKLGYIKYLIQDGTNIFTYSTTNGWQNLGTSATKTLFDTSGMDDISILNRNSQTLISPIDNLTDPQVLTYGFGYSTFAKQLQVTATVLPKLVMPVSDLNIQGILQGLTLTTTESGNGIVKVAVSSNQGTTWNYFRNGTWNTINVSDISNVKNDGMTASELGTITAAEWALLTSNNTIRIAYYVEQPYTTDVARINSLASSEVGYVSTPTLSGLNIVYDVLDQKYYGILFMDTAQNYYSTSLGEILKYLDFGTIVAGQTTIDVKVFMQNSLPFQVNNLSIWTTSGGNGVDIQFSKTTNPFIAQSSLIFNEIIDVDQTMPFYVRLSIDKNTQPVSGATFKIQAKATPVQ